MAKKRGIYTIVQYYNHPVTGEMLFNDDMLSVASNHKCIKKCAVIIHDEDVYHQSDIDNQRKRLKQEYINKQNDFVNEDGTVSISCDAYVEQEMDTTYSYIKIGEKKGKHIHIVIDTGKSAIDTADLALWFGVPEYLIDIIPKGRGNGVWYDCIRYLTHETPQAIKDGKYIYSHSDVLGFGTDWLGYDAELAEYERMIEEYGKAVNAEEAMCLDVLLKGKTPEQCKQEDPTLYLKLRDKLIKLHGDYLQTLPQPDYRLNFYIEGSGGEGKQQLMMALARSLFPEIDNDDDLYFCVGADNVTFEGYHGQPVVIWDDCRSGELIRKVGGRENLFKLFNTFPEKQARQKEHVKFSVTNLVNKVNIVNSVEPWGKFLDGLAGEYTDRQGNYFKAEDKSQSYRRFPMLICLHQEDYDILLNKGFLNDTREFLQYIAYQHIRGNFGKIAQVCKHNDALKREIAAQTVKPVVEKVRVIEDHLSKQVHDDDAIREMFADYGKIYTDKDLTAEKKLRKKDQEEKIKRDKAKKRETAIKIKAIRMWMSGHSGNPTQADIEPYMADAEAELEAEKEADLTLCNVDDDYLDSHFALE